MENKNEKNSFLKRKLHWELVNSIIKEIIEDILYFIVESGLEQNDFDEIIIIEHLPNEEELNKISTELDDKEPKEKN